MLQQTRAAAVVPYYQRFLRRFPNVRALARASEAAVLRHWSGLGYYSRARNLRRAAQLVSRGNGSLPTTFAEWTKLPGVGPYTAAAVASIAFGEPVAVLDGNVVRVMARLTNHRGDVRSPRVRDELRERAQTLLDRLRPGQFNQALMELGATVCLPRRPRCAECPIAKWCAARKLGTQDELPIKLGVRGPVDVALSVALVERDGSILLRRRPANASLMPGFWELPELLEDGLRLQMLIEHGEFRHSITWHNYRVTACRGRLRGQPPAGFHWVDARRLARLPLTTISRKALDLIRSSRNPAPSPAERRRRARSLPSASAPSVNG